MSDQLLTELLAEREARRAVPPKTEARPTEQPRDDTDLRFAFPVAAFLIGLALWPLGARFTIDGLAWIAATILSALRIPVSFAVPLSWEWYLVLIWIPYICSRVEWHPPLRRTNKRWHLAAPDIVLIWLVITGLDVLTTYFGLRAVAPETWPVVREVARSAAWALLVAIFLSGAPEWLLRQGWRRLRG